MGVTPARAARAARAVRLRHPPRLRPARAAAGRAPPPRPRLLRLLRARPRARAAAARPTSSSTAATCCTAAGCRPRSSQRALQPLLRVADAGVPVLLVPGNHERSAIPYPLLAAHEHLHVFRGPSTVVVERRGLRVAFAGLPLRARRAAGVPGAARRHGLPPGGGGRAGALPPPVRRGRHLRAPARLHVPGRRRRGAGVRPAGRRGRGALRARAPAPGPAARPPRAAPPRAGRLRGLGGAHVLRGAGRGQGLRDGHDRAGGPGGGSLACEFRPLPARPMRVHEVAGATALPAWSGRSAPRSPRPRRTSSSRCACPRPWPAPRRSARRASARWDRPRRTSRSRCAR